MRILLDMELEERIARLGGVASIEQLRAVGFDLSAVTAARRLGSVLHVRRGWYSVPGADSRLVEAVRIRGQLTCISAAAAMGLWVWDDRRLHVGVPGNGGRLNARRRGGPRPPDDPGVILHWRDRTAAPSLARQTLREVLEHVVECQPPALALAVLDSVLEQRRATRSWVEAAVGHLPRAAPLISALDPGSGAGGESILHWHLRAAGIAFETQVQIDGLYRADVRIGSSLLVEVDGREHHATVAGFERDRALDRALQARGYVVLRIAYRELLFEPERVMAVILAVVRAGRHRRRVTG